MDPGIWQTLKAASWPRFWRLWEVDDGPGWLATFSFMSLVVYAVLAALLTRDALRRFEVVAGRARRRAGHAGPPLADVRWSAIGKDRKRDPIQASVVVGDDV